MPQYGICQEHSQVADKLASSTGGKVTSSEARTGTSSDLICWRYIQRDNLFAQDGSVAALNVTQTRLVQQLDSIYENDFHDSVSRQDLSSAGHVHYNVTLTHCDKYVHDHTPAK